MASSLSSGGKLFVDGTEELVMDAIGVDARGAQAADKVAQEGARAAKIDIRLGQRGVSLQPVQGDPAGVGILIRAAFVKRFDQNIAMSGCGFADLGVMGMMRRAACAVDIEDRHVVMLLGKNLQHADDWGQPYPTRQQEQRTLWRVGQIEVACRRCGLDDRTDLDLIVQKA